MDIIILLSINTGDDSGEIFTQTVQVNTQSSQWTQTPRYLGSVSPYVEYPAKPEEVKETDTLSIGGFRMWFSMGCHPPPLSLIL